MSKHLETKNKILNLLSKKKMTLTDLSSELDLAPSTVSQHLRELEGKGFISEVENPYIRKWKYYQANKPVSDEEMVTAYSSSKIDKRIPLGGAIAAIIVFGVILLVSSAQNVSPSIRLSPGSSIPVGSTVFTISDSPALANITGVYVNISGAMIHSKTTGKWYKLPINAKTYNLVELRNTSALLSGVALKSGVYNEIVLRVSKVIATVNGTNQSAFLPSSKLMIFGNFNISNATINWVNIDFNLSESLHITGNGKIVMLPVLTTDLRQGAKLNVSRNMRMGIISSGVLINHEHCGMNENGIMATNFSVPQNMSIEVSGGHLIITGSHSMPVIIRGNGIIWISVGNAVNVSPITEITNGGTGTIGINGIASCTVKGGALECESNLSKGANAWIIIDNLSIPKEANVSWRGPLWRSGKNFTIVNASEELLLVRKVDPNATLSAFACTINQDCIIVPVTRCQNGILGQQVAMNLSYSRTYMSFYVRNAGPGFCPMFILESSSTPECISGQCMLIYRSGSAHFR
ncbi:MAG: DUF4382 domain-containing protein [Candidatus Micrarchaeaceae archaeon]